MTEPTPNPYAAPQSEVADTAPVAATPARLPVRMLLRWLLSAALVFVGLSRVQVLISNWRYFIDSMIIDPAYNPWPWLVLELCVVATGVLLGLRSRWVFMPLFLHIGLFARQIAVGGVSGLAYTIWAVELLVFGFCAWLWLRRSLR